MLRRRDPLACDSGATLLELLVVLAILALVAVLSLPGLRGPTHSVELRSAALDLTNHLRFARAAAIGRGRSVAVAFDLREHRYRTEADGRTIRLPRDIVLTLTTAQEYVRGNGTASLVFFPDGSSTGGQILLQRNGQKVGVGVNWLTGDTRIEGAP